MSSTTFIAMLFCLALFVGMFIFFSAGWIGLGIYAVCLVIVIGAAGGV